MLTPITDADGILPDLRYASVDDPLGRAAGLRAGLTRAALLASALAFPAALLAGCARDAEPATFAVPRAAAAEIRLVCPPGTFIGTMTANCPQPLPQPRAVPIR